MGDELKLDETIARSSPCGVVDLSTFEALEEALDKADAPITEGGRFLTLVERINALAARAQAPAPGEIEARAQELFALWRNDNGLICDADPTGHRPIKRENDLFCSACGETLTKKQAELGARAKNESQRQSFPAPGEAVAWIVYAENGNTRLWTLKDGAERAQRLAAEWGTVAQPLFAHHVDHASGGDRS